MGSFLKIFAPLFVGSIACFTALEGSAQIAWSAQQKVVVKRTTSPPRIAVRRFVQNNSVAKRTTTRRAVTQHLNTNRHGNSGHHAAANHKVHNPIAQKNGGTSAAGLATARTTTLGKTRNAVTNFNARQAASGGKIPPSLVNAGGSGIPLGSKPLAIAAPASSLVAGTVHPAGHLFGPQAQPRLGLPPGARVPFKPFQAKFFPAYPGYYWGGRPRFALIAVAPLLALGVAGGYWWNYETSWVRPYPSCYVGGGVYYADPYSGGCFDFTSASEGDYFVVNRRVFRWYPTRYDTPEDMIYEESSRREDAPFDDEWVKKVPPRKNRPGASRIEPSSATPVGVNVSTAQRTDCSSCLAAIGPTPGTGGQCTATIVNNCAHPVSIDGGFSRGDDRFCEFGGDVLAAGELSACTKPCGEFDMAQAYIKTASPQSSWKGQVNGCKAF